MTTQEDKKESEKSQQNSKAMYKNLSYIHKKQKKKNVPVEGELTL